MELNNLPQLQLDTPPPVTAVAGAEQNRAIEEARASLVIAKHFPRDVDEAYKRIMQSCARPGLAEKAEYRFPRGGATVSGPSIRLAEAIARNWGNMVCEVKVLEQGEMETIAQAICWDLETNYRKTITFVVQHFVMTRNGPKPLRDPRDIYEKVANEGARRLRACILAVVPSDIVDDAVLACRQTLANKSKTKPLPDRIRAMVVAFAELGVTKAQIEAKLGHTTESASPEQLQELIGIYQTLKDGMGKREDFFELKPEKNQPSDINNLLGI